MTLSFIFWTALIVPWAYVLYRDPNVTEYILLQGRNINAKLRRISFYLKHNPDFIWVRLRARANGNKEARKLAEELGLHNDKDWYNDNGN